MVIVDSCESAYDYQEVADNARKWYPQLKDRIVLGQPGRYNQVNPGVYKVDHTKSEKELRIKCTLPPLEIVRGARS